MDIFHHQFMLTKKICLYVKIFCTYKHAKISFTVTHLYLRKSFPRFSGRLTLILSMQSIVLDALTHETRANAATAAGGSTVTRLLANSAHFLCSGSDTVHHRIFLANVEWFKQIIIHVFFPQQFSLYLKYTQIFESFETIESKAPKKQ